MMAPTLMEPIGKDMPSLLKDRLRALNWYNPLTSVNQYQSAWGLHKNPLHIGPRTCWRTSLVVSLAHIYEDSEDEPPETLQHFNNSLTNAWLIVRVAGRGSCLVYKRPGHAPQQMAVVVEITPTGSHCEVCLTHELLPHWENYAEKVRESWAKMLTEMRDLLEWNVCKSSQ